MNKSLILSWCVILAVGGVFCIYGALKGLQTHEVVTEKYQLQKVVYLTAEKQDSLDISLSYEYPVCLPTSDSVVQQIQYNIKKELFGEAFSDMDPQQAISAYAAWKHTDYVQNNLPLMQEWDASYSGSSDANHGAMFCETLIIDGYELGMAQDMWSYGEDVYVYTGGAHGYGFLLTQNYDLQTGNRVYEADLFKEDYFEPLHKLLLQSLLQQTDSADTEYELRNMGYNTDDIVPNDNFYISEKGITYVYNPYDIAPYAMGRSEILLSWQNIIPLMQ